MSMTQEQALKLLEHPIYKWSMDWDEREDGLNYTEAIEIAIAALRPVSWEQVEKIKGVWIFNDDWWEFRCSECHKGIGNIEKYKFCPHCGAPMTDEAVDILLKRLEALKDGL